MKWTAGFAVKSISMNGAAVAHFIPILFFHCPPNFEEFTLGAGRGYARIIVY
jgi:hypothetical protein